MRGNRSRLPGDKDRKEHRDKEENVYLVVVTAATLFVAWANECTCSGLFTCSYLEEYPRVCLESKNYKTVF